jgi:hypothetical protein
MGSAYEESVQLTERRLQVRTSASLHLSHFHKVMFGAVTHPLFLELLR